MGSPNFCQNCYKIRLHNINKIRVLGGTTLGIYNKGYLGKYLHVLLELAIIY